MNQAKAYYKQEPWKPMYPEGDKFWSGWISGFVTGMFVMLVIWMLS